ncbi:MULTISPECIES: STAS domain-containing protein [unclassified Streptomyces]|uniref:STAS domain-containing protein n=1 Tax=unclassified Streptomyces TaxID=2593676 RepID=UPI002E81D513|nr:STAS domain-containing protein [Streptomyces sp. NBC_00589]
MHALERINSVSWPPPGDHAHLYAGAGLLLVELRGGIDLAAVPRVRPWLDSVAALPARLYVVDLRRTSFVDGTGLGMVLRFRERVTDADADFGLLCARRVHRLLRAHAAWTCSAPRPPWTKRSPGGAGDAPADRRHVGGRRRMRATSTATSSSA